MRGTLTAERYELLHCTQALERAAARRDPEGVVAHRDAGDPARGCVVDELFRRSTVVGLGAWRGHDQCGLAGGQPVTERIDGLERGSRRRTSLQRWIEIREHRVVDRQRLGAAGLEPAGS